jgi:MscS family membrane protein
LVSRSVLAADELVGSDGDSESGAEAVRAEIRSVDFSGIEWSDIGISLAIVGGGILLAWLSFHAAKQLARLADTSRFRIDGILLRTCAPPLAVFIGLISLHFSLFRIEEIRLAFTRWEGVRDAFFVLTGTWIAASLAKNLIKYYALPYALRTETDVDERILRVLDLVVLYMIWGLGCLIALNSMGIEITAFLASMGIIGLAVALAAKTVLSNVLAGVTLTADPNIEVGNRVEILGYMGDIERIHIHKTVIRTRDNLLVTIPNDVLAKEVVVNWDLPNSRTRLELRVGVDYDTDLDEATRIIYEILDEERDRFDDSREPEVGLHEFGDNALILRIHVWLTSPRGRRHVRDAVYRKILVRFRENDIEIPFPQRVIRGSE